MAVVLLQISEKLCHGKVLPQSGWHVLLGTPLVDQVTVTVTVGMVQALLPGVHGCHAYSAALPATLSPLSICPLGHLAKAAQRFNINHGEWRIHVTGIFCGVNIR